MAQNSVNYDDKELIQLDLGIEDTQTLRSDALNSFLENDVVITGDPNNITPVNNEDDDVNVDDNDTPPAPVRGKKPSTDPKPKPKNDDEAEKLLALENERKQKQQALLNALNDEDPENDSDPDPAKPSKENNADDNQDDLGNSIASFAKELYKMEFFTKDSEDESEDIKTPEELLERMNRQYRKGATQILENYLSRYGEKHRQAFSAIFEKGVDPDTYLAQLNKIESYKTLDLAVENNQERVVAEALRNNKWDEEDIKDEIQRLKNNSDLEVTAKRYVKGLIRNEELVAKELEIEREKEEQRKEAIDAQYDYNLRTIYSEKLKAKDFDGLPVTESLVSKAYDFAYNKKWELDGATLTDFDRFMLDLKKPENHEAKAKLALLLAPDYDPKKPIKIDFSRIQKRAVTQGSNRLFEELTKKSKNSSDSGKTSYRQASESFFD